MKVILTTDVPKVGNRYDVKELKDGFAQNVLIARGLAILATPKALSQLADKKKNMTQEKNEEIENTSNLIKNLKSQKIIIEVKCNEKGSLFKAVNSSDVVNAIKGEAGLIVEKNIIDVGHIKEIGIHKIKIKKGITEGEFQIEIVASK